MSLRKASVDDNVLIVASASKLPCCIDAITIFVFAVIFSCNVVVCLERSSM